MRRVRKDWKAALLDYDAALVQAPDDFGALLGRAAVHSGSGAFDQAIAAYAEIIKRYPDEPQPYNDYAWLLATSTKNELHNGTRAVELATKACTLTEWKNAAYLDTLAAAFADKSEFPEALKWQHEAVRLSDQEPAEVQAELQSRIALYEQKQSYREEVK